jgi:hypothetical protein
MVRNSKPSPIHLVLYIICDRDGYYLLYCLQKRRWKMGIKLCIWLYGFRLSVSFLFSCNGNIKYKKIKMG